MGKKNDQETRTHTHTHTHTHMFTHTENKPIATTLPRKKMEKMKISKRSFFVSLQLRGTK